MEKRGFRDSWRMSLSYLFNRSTFRERELKYIEKVWEKEYPEYIIKQVLDKAFKKHSRKNATNTTLDEQN